MDGWMMEIASERGKHENGDVALRAKEVERLLTCVVFSSLDFVRLLVAHL